MDSAPNTQQLTCSSPPTPSDCMKQRAQYAMFQIICIIALYVQNPSYIPTVPHATISATVLKTNMFSLHGTPQQVFYKC